MKKTSTLFKNLFTAIICSLLSLNVNAQAFTEDFDDITALPTLGWEELNMSNPVGTTNYFQGNGAVFPAYSGLDSNSYLGTNYNNTAGTGTISNWMMSPTLTFNNGDSIIFYTRTVDSGATVYPDRLQLNISLNGSSNNVGPDEFSVGDFSIMALDINPNYSTSGWPAGYPFTWEKMTYVISGLSGPTSGRFAFRYFVESGGPAGANSNYIGIDLASYVPAAVGINEISNALSFGVFPNPSTDFIKINVGKPAEENYPVKIVDMLGRAIHNTTIAKGSHEINIDMRSYAAGVYQAIVNDSVRKEFVKN